ncbi:trk system potassium uptake protein TrkH [Rhodovulum sp. ES.010]|uniref:TrkH family potassium uptake protein n=1 Tax=Rhodovulum sp. ES.010 TaxID=1882821 RepID=UPI00092ADFA4|nr:potassium transporter TrkG [Rhodovulum sp. ES.010]SIO47563.1 trk system potassium uptake protein TrkH [Rhodovulum sp. ES.010]
MREGADTLRARARGGVVLLTLAKHAPAFAMLYLPPAIWAAADGTWALAVHLLWPSAVAIAVFAAVWRMPLPDDLGALEAMVAVALVFLIGAVGAVPAFHALGMPLPDALFEAMSGLTTTGLSVASAPDAWPFAAHALRAWLQWVGGLVIATAVLALILPAGVPTRRLGEAGMDEADRIASTRRKARQLLSVYLGLTVLMGAATLAAIPDGREAVVLTLAAISTGGFAPRADSLASYSGLAQGVVMLTCLLGSVSLLTYALALKGRFGDAWHLGSLRRVLSALAILCAIYAVALAASGDVTAAEGYRRLLDLVSALTTAGYSTGGMPLPGFAMTLFFVAMILGADTGSTGGGLKLSRAVLMLQAFRYALRAPSMPERSVTPLRQDGEKVADRTIIGVLALAFIYAGAALLVCGHFTWRGYPLAPALFETLSALSTVGLSAGLVGPDLPWDLKLSLIFAMWLGRLEFIAVLVLFLPRTWQKGR